MNSLRIFLASAATSAAALPSFAQQAPLPNYSVPMHNYEHMWSTGWGWHPGFVLGPFVLLLALIGVVALILWLVRWHSHGGHHHWYGSGDAHAGPGRGHVAFDILCERLARGEIDKAEFEEKRRLIGH